REAGGEMSVLEELRFGDGDEEEGDLEDDGGWMFCFAFDPDTNEWSRLSTGTEAQKVGKTESISISSYNIMAEPTADPFTTRLPLIIEALSSPITPSPSSLQILTLQEVNDESLPLILSSPYIRKIYPYSTHAPSSLLPSARNLVTLASEPFTSTVISFEERHKSALIASFDFESGSETKRLVIANVHLTSGLTDKAVKAKKEQMEKLSMFLLLNRGSKSETEVVVAGDFNLTTSTRTVETALSRGLITAETAQTVGKVIDLGGWEDAFLTPGCGPGSGFENEVDLVGHDGQEIFEGEQGATFDRTTNPIATVLEPPIDRSPQRYDRVLYRKGGSISSVGLEIFGLPNEEGRCGSDHYGVRATLNITGSGISISGTLRKNDIRNVVNKIPVVEDTTDFTPLIKPYLPTQSDISQREHAIQLLHDTFSKGGGLEGLILVPLGSYLMGTYFADSDVDVLAIGSVSPSIFFEFAARELRKLDAGGEGGDGEHFKGVHFVNSLVSIVEVCVLGIKFDLQYCQAEELIRAYQVATPSPSLPDLVFDKSLISTLAPSSIRPLNTYRDSAYLLLTIPHLPSYRLAHRYLTLYLKTHGLYSAKFGYLGGIHLQLMLNRVVKLISRSTSTTPNTDQEIPPISPATIVRTFFTYYTTFNWTAENITDPFLDPPSKVPRSARDAIFIPAIHTPTARPNVASSCTRLTAHTFSSQFALAARHLESGDWEWPLRSKKACLADFLGGSGA
ncbi:hypothetical protein IFR05_017313, partial [Cadophora sp. M221]